jgi:tetratricopeptide (TPR) repeat protein
MWLSGWSLGLQVQMLIFQNKRKEIIDQLIHCLRRLVSLNPKNSLSCYALGEAFSQKAKDEEDREKRLQLFEDAILAYYSATKADPKMALAWGKLGMHLESKAEEESDTEKRVQMREEAIACLRSASVADPNLVAAWGLKAALLGLMAEEEANEQKRREMLEEANNACNAAVETDPKCAPVWGLMGVFLQQKADEEDNQQKHIQLRKDAIAASRSAIQADPKCVEAWLNISTDSLKLWHLTHDPFVLREALCASQKASDSCKCHYNLSCALALLENTDEAFDYLEKSIANKEVTPDHIRRDRDWQHLRHHPRFIALVGESQTPPANPAVP